MTENNTEDEETEQKIVNKVQKVITIKRNLSEKQQKHLETLASKRKGKVYKEVVKQEEVPEVVKVITKKPRSKKVVEVVESESEEESSEEEIIVKKKVKKIPDQEPKKKAVKKAVKIPEKETIVPKKKAVKKVVPTPVVVENSSSFRSKLF